MSLSFFKLIPDTFVTILSLTVFRILLNSLKRQQCFPMNRQLIYIPIFLILSAFCFVSHDSKRNITTSWQTKPPLGTRWVQFNLTYRPALTFHLEPTHCTISAIWHRAPRGRGSARISSCGQPFQPETGGHDRDPGMVKVTRAVCRATALVSGGP